MIYMSINLPQTWILMSSSTLMRRREAISWKSSSFGLLILLGQSHESKHSQARAYASHEILFRLIPNFKNKIQQETPEELLDYFKQVHASYYVLSLLSSFLLFSWRRGPATQEVMTSMLSVVNLQLGSIDWYQCRRPFLTLRIKPIKVFNMIYVDSCFAQLSLIGRMKGMFLTLPYSSLWHLFSVSVQSSMHVNLATT